MMISLNTKLAFVVALASVAVEAQEGEGSPKMKCLDTSRHKAASSPESLSKCEIYAGNSCCTKDTSERVFGSDLYNFTKFLCKKQQDLSPECKKFFLKDACFYECSPNIATWASVVDDRESVRNIPLCKSDCDDWFAACANDFTCTKDWKKAHEQQEDFKCYENDKCQTIKDKFKSADDFCRKIWGNSYDVVPDGPSCVKINLKSKADVDQNSKVAEQHKENSSPSLTYNIVIVSLPMLIAPWI